MRKPRICISITSKDLTKIKGIEPLVDLLEVRIDHLGDDWPEVVRQIKKPWIACCRNANEDGKWQGNEDQKVGELLKAADMGADIVDIELASPNLKKVVAQIKQRTKCLVSIHIMDVTPPFDELKKIVQHQLEAGADVCKVVTNAQKVEDNLTVLQLITEFPSARIVAFAMGPLGLLSRILCPVVGGDFVYAAVEPGMEIASGQVSVEYMRKAYKLMGV